MFASITDSMRGHQAETKQVNEVEMLSLVRHCLFVPTKDIAELSKLVPMLKQNEQ